MDCIAYLAGAAKGDLSVKRALQLCVKDKDFAETVAQAVRAAFGVPCNVRPMGENSPYWGIGLSNVTGRFSLLTTYAPQTNKEKADWLKGLFDSEGSVTLSKVKERGESYVRLIRISNSNTETLDAAKAYLEALGMGSYILPLKHTNGHKGSKPMFNLVLNSSLENYETFKRLIGCSIARKRIKLDEVIESYRLGSEARRLAAIKGTKAKHQKTINETLPRVVNAIALRLSQGEPIRHRDLVTVKGYSTLLRYYTHKTLIDLAWANLPKPM